MDDEHIQLGFSSHFSRELWKEDYAYFKSTLELFERDADIFTSPVRKAFHNVVGFLLSVQGRDKLICKRKYLEILETDKSNINARIGLYEVHKATSKHAAQKAETEVNKLIHAERNDLNSRRAIAYSLLEIGIALCRLIPQYRVTQPKHTSNENDLDRVFRFGRFDLLRFQTKLETKKVEAYSDCNIAVRDATYKSVRYLEEGITRLIEINEEAHTKEIGEANDDSKQKESKQTKEAGDDEVLVWRFFLGMAYNRLDNLIRRSKTVGEMTLTRQFVSLRSLEIFCEIIMKMILHPNVENEIYYQRSLAYIGHILTSRKTLLLKNKLDGFIPECITRCGPDYMLHKIWQNPQTAFEMARDRGQFDPVVETQLAKTLLHKDKLDEAIKLIDKVFVEEGKLGINENTRINWYAASIRMKAYFRKHIKNFLDAKRKQSFADFSIEFILKAVKDAEYCFNAACTPDELHEYAKLLHYLGKVPDGDSVTDPEKIENALIVLEDMYTEQRCHTDYTVHRIKAQCHYDLDDLDDAIKYMTWALNCRPYPLDSTSLEFLHVVDYLLKKTKKQTEMQRDEALRKIRYYIKLEIKQCHLQLQKAKRFMKDEATNVINRLLSEFDRNLLMEAKDNADPLPKRAKQKMLIGRYTWIVNLIRRWCCGDNSPEYSMQMKRMLELTTESKCNLTSLMVSMCLKHLEIMDPSWTQDFRMRWEAENRNVITPSIFVPNSKADVCDAYDYLLIHAPEDYEWVHYRFLDEMEDRPKQFKGNECSHVTNLIDKISL